MEGPFINHEKKGAHPEVHIRQLDNQTAQYLASYSDVIKVLTLAPEQVSQTAIDILTNAGITVSVGHSNATYQQLIDKNGVTMATHLFNAMSQLTSREPGVVGYVFDQQIYAGIIADGIHCDYANINIAAKLLKNKLFLVSDAVTPAGSELKEFQTGDEKVFVNNGKCHFKDGTIACSTLTMVQGVKNLITKVGLSREQALNMASYFPAQAINVDNQYGLLKVGYKANITLLDQNNDVQQVYQMGRKAL